MPTVSCRFRLAIGVGVAIGWTVSAAGQDTSAADKPEAGQESTQAADDEQVGNEIVVTARKRMETVQDVPSSVRALSGDELTKLGADALEDFAGQVPGLTVSGNRASAQIFIRGVSTGRASQDQPAIKETVGLYLDETPIAVQRFSPNLKLFDLERVEVLRGPQGTLFGAGSMAGAIRLITNKPDTNDISAEVRGQLAQVSRGGTTRGVDAMANLPIVTDVLALRAVGFYRRNAGFIDNVATGEDNANSDVSKGGRLALRLTPTSTTTADALITYQRSRYNARSLFAEEEGYLRTNVAVDEPYVDRNFSAALIVNQELDPFDLTVVSSFRRKSLDYFTEVGVFPSFLGVDPTSLPLAILDNDADQRDFSGEVRFASKPGSPIQWTVGAYYENKRNAYDQDLTVPGIDAGSGLDSRIFAADADQLFVSDINLRERQIAVFGEVVFAITEAFKTTLGGRYFDARQRSTVDFGGVFASPNIGVSRFRNKESGFNPKVNVSYEISSDRMVYAQAAKGFRLGGTAEPVPAAACAADLAARGLTEAPESYNSDSLWNYEVGAKTSWLDRALTINVAAYKIKWRNPQVSAQLGCGFNVFVNAGGLDIFGTELETIVRPMRGLILRGGLGYTDSELTEDLAFVSGREGDNAPFVPKWTFNASLDYTRPLSAGLDGFLFLNAQRQGRRDTRFDPAGTDNSRLAAYTIVGARVGVSADRWSAEIFAENLANSRGRTNRQSFPFALTPITLIEVVTPRTLGVEVTLRYR